MTRADKRKYHYIYKTTCMITGKYYIGMHSTDDLEDGYVGSGKRLWYSINKHGKENHVCEILEFLPDRKALKDREAELVCEDKLTDPLCMNLVLGGGGGFDHINSSMSIEERKLRSSRAGKVGGKVAMRKLHANPENRKKAVETRKKNGSFKTKGTTGYAFSLQSKNRMSEAKVGDKNNSFGTCWIYNESEQKNLRIRKEDLNSYIDMGWECGRKTF